MFRLNKNRHTKGVLIFLFCFLFQHSFSQNNFEIIGNIKNSSGRKIYLGNKRMGFSQGTAQLFYDSCISNNDSFYFKGRFTEKDIYSVEIEGSKGWVYFFIDTGKIYINGDINEVYNSRVVGSEEENLYREFSNKYIFPISTLITIYRDSISNALKRGDSIRARIFYETEEFHENQLALYVKKFVKNNRCYFVSLYLVDRYKSLFANDSLKDLFEGICSELKLSAAGQQLRSKIRSFENKLPGAPIISFRQKDVYDSYISNKDYSGKYLLLDFWASWCAPCLNEVKKLIPLYNKYKINGFEIVGIGLDFDKKQWLKAIQENKIPWTTLCDLNGEKNQIALDYNIEYIPQKILFSEEGKVVSINPTIEEIKSYLERELE